MRWPVNRNLPLAALIMWLASGAAAQSDSGSGYPPNGPQADYPMVLGKPYRVDGVVYTPADTLNYDVVGWAGVSATVSRTITASHRTLPLPSYVEITALDTGRTILVRLERRGPMTGQILTELSQAAAEQLGILGQDGAAIRMRRVNPPEQERAALRSGRAVPARMDTPPSLRAALLRRLEQQGAEAQVSRPGPMPPPGTGTVSGGARAGRAPMAGAQRWPGAVQPTARPAIAALRPPVPGRFLVQVGAFSSRERAAGVASSLGAQVVPGGGVWRVRLTGLRTAAEAQAALDKARAAGYGDARIQRAD